MNNVFVSNGLKTVKSILPAVKCAFFNWTSFKFKVCSSTSLTNENPGGTLKLAKIVENFCSINVSGIATISLIPMFNKVRVKSTS